MTPHQVFILKNGSPISQTYPNSTNDKDKFDSVIGGNTGFNKTKKSVSLLASLGCTLTKVGRSYIIYRKYVSRSGKHQTTLLGTYKKSEFFELALTLNPKLGKDETN